MTPTVRDEQTRPSAEAGTRLCEPGPEEVAAQRSKGVFMLPSFSRRTLLVITTLALLGAAGVGFFVFKPFDKAPETVVVSRQTLVESVEVSGVAESSQHVVLKAKLAGTVKQLAAPENQRVAASALLLELDDAQARLNLNQARSTYEANVRQAQTQRTAALQSLAEAKSRQAVTLTTLENQLAKARTALALAERDIGRIRELAKEGAVSRQTLEQQEQQWRQGRLDVRIAQDNLARARTGTEVVAAQNALAQAETALKNATEQGRSALALAEQAVADTRLKAPFAGVITEWTVEVGDTIAPGTPLGTFQNLDKLRVRLPVDELDLPKMRLDGPVELLFDAYPERTYAGKIVKISRASVEGAGNVRVFPIEVQFENQDQRISPGMSCDATVVVRKLPDVLAVPIGAVIREDGGYQVKVLDAENKTRTVPIEPGLTTLEAVEVKSGLKEGDRVLYTAAEAK